MNPVSVKLKENQSSQVKSKGLPEIFRSLGSRNFRLFFIGQAVSLTGTWMQSIAMSWLVYRLTGSALLLGVVGFSSQLPVFILASLAGVFVDRHNRHRILIITQTLSMIQAFVLAVLVFTNLITVWTIVVLSITLGLINAVDMPARQAFIMETIDNKENLGNAIALNSSVFNSARLIGPSIGGVVIAIVGEGLCFLWNGLSFLSVIFCLIAMRTKNVKREHKESQVLRELKEGFSYTFSFSPVRNIMLLLALVSLVGMPYTVLMPVFSADVLKGGADTLGYLLGAVGLGAFIGTVFLASRKGILGLERNIVIGPAIFGTGLILFALSRTLALSIPMVIIAGFGMITQMATSNTIIQSIVDDDKRGPVMSIYAMSLVGMAPFG
ncbi:MAG: MFS transporter, partial [Chloroflexi bacterium RBG_16_48_7]